MAPVATAYAEWRARFAAAMDPRLFTIEHLDGLLMRGEAWLWCAGDAAIVAEIRTFPTGARAVHGLVAAGTLDGVRRLIAEAEAWGRAQGCVGALIESRDGWAKALKADGYNVFQTSIWKDL